MTGVMQTTSRTRYWHELGDGVVQCDLCPRACRLRPEQRGFCFVRANSGGKLELSTYGRSSGFHVDPIEKKPLNHVAPGTTVLSFGTAGCNLACKFCQNWEISTARSVDLLYQKASPADIAEVAVRTKCRGIAYTYNDPIIFAEYAIDTAQAARERGLLNIAVTAGYINPEPRADFFDVMDAANVDLKSFSRDFYQQVVGGRLEVVQETLSYIVHETNCWLEITTLLIPGLNDSDAEVHALSEWIATELGPDVPLHFTAFHPDNRMRGIQRTPASTLLSAREIALRTGLNYVYTGNISDAEGATTSCPSCAAPLVVRDRYEVSRYDLTTDGCCPRCETAIPGLWDSQVGRLGRRRLPRPKL